MRRRKISALLFVLIVSLLGGLLAAHSWRARWQYELARKLEERGRHQAAYRMYQAALGTTSDKAQQSQIHYQMGECLWNLGRAGEAFSQFQQAVEADGSNLPARLRLGEIMLAGGAVDGATAQAAAVLESGLKSADALALLGAASAASGQDELAQIAFTKVLEADPGRINVAIALADIYNREDKVDDAREVLKQAARTRNGSALPLLALGRLEEQEGDADAAEHAYRTAVQREPTPETLLRLAQFLERSGQVNEAKKILQQADHMRPRQPTALPDFELLAGRAPDALDGYMEALRSYALDRRHDSAPEVGGVRAALAARIIEADLELAHNSDDSQAAAQAARLHMDQFRRELDAGTVAILEAEIALTENDVAQARAQAEKAVALGPGSAAAHYMLGVAAYRAGDTAQARSAWLGALDRDSDFVPARLALAREALRNDDPSGAEQYVLPTVRDEPANLEALAVYGEVLLAQKRPAALKAIANRALTVDNNAVFPHLLLGQAALQQANIGEAMLQFERAVLLDPRSHQAIEGLVSIYRRGRISRSMLYKLEEAGRKPPPSAALMEVAGRLYAEHGWYGDAQRCLKLALVMDPRRSTAADALAEVFAARGKVGAAIASANKLDGETTALLSGVSAQQHNRIDDAIAHYEAALRVGEHSGVAANNLAWLYAQQGTRLDRALQLAEKARAQAPENPAVLDTVGFVHLRRREYSEAINVLKDARDLAVQKPVSSQVAGEIRRHLSEAYLRAGISEPGN